MQAVGGCAFPLRLSSFLLASLLPVSTKVNSSTGSALDSPSSNVLDPRRTWAERAVGSPTRSLRALLLCYELSASLLLWCPHRPACSSRMVGELNLRNHMPGSASSPPCPSHLPGGGWMSVPLLHRRAARLPPDGEVWEVAARRGTGISKMACGWCCL